ncbi:hypothetical protein EBZ80_14385, partial [bacterium]|nr:hypothetical protein [bacterium]
MSVDLLKQLLRSAIQAKASTLHILAGKAPSIDPGTGPVEIQMPAITPQQILDMIEGIAPAEKQNLVSQGQQGKVRGGLNLGAAGKVNFVATSVDSQAASMIVFFGPGEDKKTDDYWQNLSAAQTKKPAQQASAQPNPLPPEAFSATATAKAKVAGGNDA